MRKSYVNFNANATSKGSGSKAAAPVGKPAAAPVVEDTLADVPEESTDEDPADATDAPEGATDEVTDTVDAPEGTADAGDADADLAAEMEAEQKAKRTQEYADSLDIITSPGRVNSHVVRKTIITVQDKNSPFFGKQRMIVNFAIRTWADAEAGRVNASFGYPLEPAGNVTADMVRMFGERFGCFNSGDSCELEIDDKGFVKTMRPLAMATVIRGSKSAAPAKAERLSRYIVQGGFIIERESGDQMMATTAPEGTTYNTLPRVAPRVVVAAALPASDFEQDLPF